MSVELSPVTDLFRLAAFDGSLWMKALDALAQATGARSGNLIGVKGGVLAFDWISNMDPQLAADIPDHVRGHPSFNPRVMHGIEAAPLEVFSGIDYAADDWTRRFPEYGELCRRYDFGCGSHAVLHRSEEGFIGLATLRTAREGNATAEQDRIFAELAPHALDAVRLRRIIADYAVDQSVETLDAVQTVAVICDEAGRALGLTQPAERLLSSGGALSLRLGRLTAFIHDEDALLHAAIQRASELPNPLIETFALRDAAGGEWVVEVAALPRDAWSVALDSRAIVTIKPSRRGHTPTQILSPRERDCLRLLAQGQRPKSIGHELNIATVTVDLHLRNARLKLGARTMAEAVAMAMRAREI